jgi:lipopolysaccharide transport system ATP-binding protein
MMIKTISGLELGGAASHLIDNSIEYIEQGSKIQVQFRFHCCLQPGVYFLNAGVLGEVDETEVFLHRCIDAAMFRVQLEEEILETALIDFQTEAYAFLIYPGKSNQAEPKNLDRAV